MFVLLKYCNIILRALIRVKEVPMQSSIESLIKVISEKHEAEYEEGNKGGTLLKKDFEEFIAKRCEKALLESEEYIKLERNGNASPEELQELAEIICYKQCFDDFVAKIKV